MAKVKNQVEETEVEDTEEETPKGMRPSDLADELEVSAKSLRGFLRRTFPRGDGEKNTNWFLNEDQVEAARKHFTESDEDEAEDTGDEDE